MKSYNLYLPLLLSLLAFPLTAQIEFAPTGARYIYQQTDVFLGVDTTYSFPTMEVVGDTVLNGQSCKKLSLDHSVLEWTCFDPDAPTGFTYMYETAGQVFRWNKYTEAFELLYDFNKNAGESWEVSNFCGQVESFCELGSFTAMVDSVSFVELNGTVIKVQHVDIGFGSRTFPVYEGIGSIDHPTFLPSSWCATFDNYRFNGLRCYQAPVDGDFTFFSDQGDCFNVVSTHDPGLTAAITLFPNPAKAWVTVELEGAFSLELLDMHGRLLTVSTLGDKLGNDQSQYLHSANLDLRSLPSGVYFLRLTQGEKWGTKRIVKHE